MSDDPSQTVKKGERTQQRILEAALALFVDKGYEKTTMRDIVGEAGCSLGLAYHYFSSKEELVLALYRNLTSSLEKELDQLAPGSVADRFFEIVQAKLRLVQPFPEPLGALFSTVLGSRARMSGLGERARSVRHQEEEIFRTLIRNASDAPPASVVEPLTSILYLVHLGVLVFWLHDQSKKYEETQNLVALLREILAQGSIVFSRTWSSRALIRFGRILSAVLPKSSSTSTET